MLLRRLPVGRGADVWKGAAFAARRCGTAARNAFECMRRHQGRARRRVGDWWQGVSARRRP